MDRQSLIRALRDTAQSASNAVASNVSGPVDLLAAGLRGVGLPIPESPVGGSQWMRDRGLTAPVQQGAAQVVGETLGMAGPALAANFAPQIARAANSLDDKAVDMARQGIEGQMVRSGFIQPATVWHGSPHKFDKFDSSKIGTGEGAQAYGHGLYLAESDKVAGEYAKNLSARKAAYKVSDGRTLQFEDDLSIMLDDVANKGGDLKDWIQLTGDEANDPMLKRASELAKTLVGKKIEAMPSQGNLYKVDLPDDAIAKMLDWDKPLSQQRGVMDALYDSPIGRGGYAKGAMGERRFVQPLQANRTGAALLEDLRLLTGPTKAEETLRQAGIPGIRYLDGGSRGAGSGSSNFVIFPGNENILNILERNGQPLGMMGIK